MVRQKEAKNAALLTAVVIILMSFTFVPDWSVVGIAEGAPLAARFVYSFSCLHVSCPCKCLVSAIHSLSL